jgi:hypothetical protein
MRAEQKHGHGSENRYMAQLRAEKVAGEKNCVCQKDHVLL